ncbi:MAG: AzlD domain-containing protein [Tissierellia bacterium]|nr:AzlD domain-containing protein [Tissierellia bacterium]
MSYSPYLEIFVMALVTYLIRSLPLTLIRKQIKSTFIRSFLYYVPYVTLSLLIFPAILDATNSLQSALAGFITALALAFFGKSLLTVSILSCVVVFVVEMLPM